MVGVSVGGDEAGGEVILDIDRSRPKWRPRYRRCGEGRWLFGDPDSVDFVYDQG